VSAPGGSPRRRHEARRLADVRSVLPQILYADAASLPAGCTTSDIGRLELTSTDVVVAVLEASSRAPSAVIKVALTAQAAAGLEREREVLDALGADERLGDWRKLVPRPYADGTACGRRYRIDSGLAGRSVLGQLGDTATRTRLLESAAATIHILHRRSATPVVGGDELVHRWIDAHVQVVANGGAARRERFRRLRQELREAIGQTAFSAGWVHGDYWLGNLLYSTVGGFPDGVVDWDAAGRPELPLHDVLHLLLYTRRLVTGKEIGEIVRDKLGGDPWTEGERRLFDAYGAWCHDGALSDRHVILLYWLRHVAHHARQQRRRWGWRYRIWEHHNVNRVLEAL
jgi:aminoglycoside phosphotransferase (APT) family kinase protein